jgi:predicted DCC family thiol-disulfide oxidoreductase YuxK
MSTPETFQLSVFFDGLCPLCSREIEHYRKLKGSSSIQWVDITRPEFDAVKEGLDPKLVHKFFHVKTQDGEIVAGVDAFIEIWKRLPSLKAWVELSRLPGVKSVMKAGYAVFAQVRPLLPRRSSKDCASGTCAR